MEYSDAIQEISGARTPMDLMALALSNNAAIDVIERLSALQRQYVAEAKEQLFNESMSDAQSEIGRVAPDLTNPQTHSKYPSYAALDRVLRPIYTKHGFALSFDEGDTLPNDWIQVVCYVSHKGGYTRKYHKNMPADGKGAKGGDVMTKTHAVAAADSYGMRYILKKVFNVAIGEDDLDGNSYQPPAQNGTGMGAQKRTLSNLQEYVDEIGRCESVDGLRSAFKTAYVAAKSINDENAVNTLTQAYEFMKGKVK